MAAQDYYRIGYLRYEDRVYSPLIRSVILEKKNQPLSDPAIAFQSDEQLVLMFDELRAEASDFSYSFVLCNSNWEPASLPVLQVLPGFTDDRIRTFRHSFNTRQPYVHYRLEFPEDYMRPRLPGNYLIKVYPTEHPDSVILTRRWIYYEDQVEINAQVKRATIVSHRFSRQEVDFTLRFPGLPIRNPQEEIKVVILQNFRWDRMIDHLKPLFIHHDLLDYNYDEENTFDGGNEYRTFDTRSYRFLNQYMKRFEEDSTGIHAWIKEEGSRASIPYTLLDDINGRFLPVVYEGRQAATEAEYIHTHFHLRIGEPLPDATLYVYGALTGWEIIPQARMVYNYETSLYECSLYLKQGYYNYSYVLLKDGESRINDTHLEGNHSDTENNYTILVYHTPPGARFDRLSGYKKISSRGIF
jgi:hypothetical protein